MSTADPRLGILYFIDSNPLFREMMELSVRSLRRFHPDIPITVLEVPKFPVPAWKKLYRKLSYWKYDARRRRANQDARVIAAKADAMLDSPYDVTLYLDADTYIQRPLDDVISKALECDVLATQFPWKTYSRIEDWQPESWPFVMAGLNFYSKRFCEAYRPYIDRLRDQLATLPTMEQFTFSLCCHEHADDLNIVYDQRFQLDHLNLKYLLERESWPTVGNCIDLTWDGIREFDIFHYNDLKPGYMEQVRNLLADSPPFTESMLAASSEATSANRTVVPANS